MLLPFERLEKGSFCNSVDDEYQVIFIKNETDLSYAWEQIHANDQPDAEVKPISVALTETDFEKYRLLFAWRKCMNGLGLNIAQVIEAPDDRIVMYLEFEEAAPGSMQPAVAIGYYEFVQIPWTQDKPDNPMLEAVIYKIWTN